ACLRPRYSDDDTVWPLFEDSLEPLRRQPELADFVALVNHAAVQPDAQTGGAAAQELHVGTLLNMEVNVRQPDCSSCCLGRSQKNLRVSPLREDCLPGQLVF